MDPKWARRLLGASKVGVPFQKKENPHVSTRGETRGIHEEKEQQIVLIEKMD